VVCATRAKFGVSAPFAAGAQKAKFTRLTQEFNLSQA
jgi:hypothetical protein